MATLKQIKDKANKKLAQFWVLLQSKQDAYFAKHGKYFQLIVSPSTSVVGGLDSDFILNHPSDEVSKIDVDFPWTEKIPFQIEVHEWVAPNNETGYIANVYIELPDGRIFTRNRDSNQVDSDWFELVTPI